MRFGDIKDQTMELSAAGDIASACWLSIPEHYPTVQLDAFVIMPNHVHGILDIISSSIPFPTVLGKIINAYKGAVTARLHAQQIVDGIVWQSRYHDHIIRNDKDLQRIREYIENNPARWAEDTFFASA
jgi:REP element-mobilizing transposase RayT